MTRFRRKFLALTISALVSGTAVEMVLRYLCVACTWMESNTGRYVPAYQVPPVNSWYHVRSPNTISHYGQPEFDYELRTNSLGIRDVEHPVEKPEGEFRIVGLGDSFTEGQGASFDNTYLQVLARNLNEKLKRPHVVVIVGGVAGSDPFFSYKLLQDKLLKFKPDLITLTMNKSDVMDTIGRGGNERFLADGTVQFAEPRRDEWFFARSHLYRVLVYLLGYDWLGFRGSQQIAKRTEAVEKLKTIVGQYYALAIREKCRFVVILHQHLDELLTETYSFDAAALMRYFDDHGIDYVDLMKYFLKTTSPKRESREKLYWKKDFHFNEAGYRIFAEGVEEYLLVNGMIELEPPD